MSGRRFCSTSSTAPKTIQGRGSANRSRVLWFADANGPASFGGGGEAGGRAASMRAEIASRSVLRLRRRVCSSRSTERSDRFRARSPRIRFNPVLTLSPMEGLTRRPYEPLWSGVT